RVVMDLMPPQDAPAELGRGTLARWPTGSPEYVFLDTEVFIRSMPFRSCVLRPGCSRPRRCSKQRSWPEACGTRYARAPMSVSSMRYARRTSAFDPFDEQACSVDDQHHTQHTIVLIHVLGSGSCVLNRRISGPRLRNARGRSLTHDGPQPERSRCRFDRRMVVRRHIAIMSSARNLVFAPAQSGMWQDHR